MGLYVEIEFGRRVQANEAGTAKPMPVDRTGVMTDKV